jgi:uncharacterized protein
MILRTIEPQLLEALENMPAVALLGPRQVGKSTLAHKIADVYTQKPKLLLDLESEFDRTKLTNPEAYLSQFGNHLIIIDEVQRQPELFSTLRVLIDQRKRAGERAGQFLLLGSASRDLLQQSSESLAGRIRYMELSPFQIDELPEEPLEKRWLRGGYPDSFLASNDRESWNWRGDFIETYVERDIPQVGFRVSSARMRTFWKMLAQLQGQQVNLSMLGKALEVSHTTVRSYLDILGELFMVRELPPWSGNTRKRLLKSPKVYIRDSGLLHRLAMITDLDTLLGHPLIGFSWEGFVIESILSHLSNQWQVSYYRTAEQTEIDLILENATERWAIEIKRNLTPKVPAGFIRAAEDIEATRRWIVYSGFEQFPMPHQTTAIGLRAFLALLKRS